MPHYRAGARARLPGPPCGERASIPRGDTRIPAGAPVPIYREDDRRLSGLPERSHKADRLWRSRRGLEPPMADDRRRQSQRSLGTQGVRSLGVRGLPIIWWHTLAGADGELTSTAMSTPDRKPDLSGQTETSGGPSLDAPERHPGLKLIVDHMGVPRVSKGEAAYRSQPEPLAMQPARPYRGR
jgi:hypothetical protein